MRRVVVLLFAAVCLPAATALGQHAYAGVLLKYLTGDADAAVAQLAAMPTMEAQAGIDAFNTTRSRLVLPGAAAMHTEVAFQHSGEFRSAAHLDMATAIVEFGERRVAKSNVPPKAALHPQYARPVPDEFRRMWYCAVISGFESAGVLTGADRYLAHALALYPDNAEIHLLAGIAEEMRASRRVATVSDGARRKALATAETHYRRAIAVEPDRLEAQLRLGRVLDERDELNAARTVLTPLTHAPDVRIAYLAGLFLGGIEDRMEHPGAAYALYEEAATHLPIAQAARLAASELRHRSGDRRAAADAVPAAAGPGNSFDPWWTYVFGEYWRTEILLNALRAMRHTT